MPLAGRRSGLTNSDPKPSSLRKYARSNPENAVIEATPSSMVQRHHCNPRRPMQRFSDLHFFLDESGQFFGPKRDLALVGGVLVFGRYDDAADGAVRDMLRNRLADVGGQFPQDLHFFESQLSIRA